MPEIVKVSRKQVKLIEELNQGGEARVYLHGKTRCIRVLRGPDDPLFADNPDASEAERQHLADARKAARQRLAELANKLKKFPTDLPPNVIGPLEPVCDRSGKDVIGHTMQLVRNAMHINQYCDLGDRAIRGVSITDVTQLFLKIYDVFVACHEKGIVFADWNDGNVLVVDGVPYFIDALSYQFGNFRCTTYLQPYVDPQICVLGDDAIAPLVKVRAHSKATDWYAFWTMFMMSALGTHPYGGRFVPEEGEEDVPHAARPFHGISVFDPRVQPSWGAIPWQHLPDELIQYLEGMFARGERVPAPRELLENLEWKQCPDCGLDYARPKCPTCHETTIVRVKRETVVTELEVVPVFQSPGVLVHAGLSDDGATLRYVYHDGQAFCREDGSLIARQVLQPNFKFGFYGEATVYTLGGKTYLRMGEQLYQLPVEVVRGGLPAFDANDRHVYWVQDGYVVRDSRSEPVQLVQVLPNGTPIWVGPDFGFGFFRSGRYQRAFLFDAEEPGERLVELPPIPGRVMGMECCFTSERLWLFFSTEERGTVLNHVYVILSDGQIEATAEAPALDNSWLGRIKGKAAAVISQRGGQQAECLMSSSPNGVVGLVASHGTVVERAHYEATASLVNERMGVLFGKQGLFTFDTRQISRIYTRKKKQGETMGQESLNTDERSTES